MRTVRARLTLFNVVVVALILGLMGVFVRIRVQANLLAEIDRSLREQVSAVKTGTAAEDSRLTEIDHFFKSGQPKTEARRVTQILRSDADEVRLEAKFDAPKIIPVNARVLGPMAPDDPEALGRAKPYVHDFARAGEPMRSYTVPVVRDGKRIADVQAVRSLDPVRRQIADLDRALAMSIPIALLLAAGGGAVLVGGALRPLRRMNEAAHRLEADPSAARLPAEGSDEFAELAGSVNAAFDRQARVLAQLERFTGDAGHELRTPLATVKANASFLRHVAEVPEELRLPVERIDTSADRMARLIDDLLLLARQDAGRAEPRFAESDLQTLIHDVIDRVPNRGKIPIEVCAPDQTLRIDSDRFERVLCNLVSNAVRHARSRVRVEASTTDGSLVLKVRDDGEGIAPEHLPRLGERFFRPDESRSREEGGVGLGLAIVRSLTEGLNFESEPGRGTVVRATLPLG